MAFGLSGCQSWDVTYSNLVDEKTLKKVMDWMTDFNLISKEYSYKKGFVRLPKDGVNYDMLYLDDTVKSYEYLNWLNCRLTAFSLIQNVVETLKDENTKDNWLMWKKLGQILKVYPIASLT